MFEDEHRQNLHTLDCICTEVMQTLFILTVQNFIFNTAHMDLNSQIIQVNDLVCEIC
jgi:hypothetical protein